MVFSLLMEFFKEIRIPVGSNNITQLLMNLDEFKHVLGWLEIPDHEILFYQIVLLKDISTLPVFAITNFLMSVCTKCCDTIIRHFLGILFYGECFCKYTNTSR